MKKVSMTFAALFSAALLLPGQQRLLAQTPEAGTDMTDRIANPTMEVEGGKLAPGWTLENKMNQGNTAPSFGCMECWNTTFDFYQEITNLPPGIYNLSVQSFYRDGYGGKDEVIAHVEGTERIRTVLYCKSAIREQTQKVISLYGEDFQPTVNYVEIEYPEGVTKKYIEGMESTAQAFNAGAFVNNVEEIFVGEDGYLRIGIKSDALENFRAGSWTIWDNFKLEYSRPIEDKDFEQLCDVLVDEITLDYSNLSYSGAMDILDKAETWYENGYGETKEEILATRDQLDLFLAEMKAGQTASDSLSNIHLVYAMELLKGTGYTQEAIDALQGAISKAQGYLSGDEKEDGSLVYAADLRALSLELIELGYQLRFSKPLTEDEKINGADYTWRVLSPNFTEEGYEISDKAHQSSKGWKTDNRNAAGEAGKGDFRLNYIGEKNCWNNWTANSTDCSYMNVYQEFNNLPSGYYTISAVHTTANTLGDQHLYGKTTFEQKNSPVPAPVPSGVNWDAPEAWQPVQVDSIFVGTDGYLRIGMESNLTTQWPDGWFCFTEVKLTYFPAGDMNPNEVIRKSLLAQGDTLLKKDFLPIQKNWLTAAKTTLAEADITTDEAAAAAFTVYNEVLDSCQTAVADYAAFMDGDYKTLAAYAEDPDMIYEENLVAFFSNLLPTFNATISSPEFTPEAFGVMKDMVKKYITFAEKYTEVYDLSSISVEEVQTTTMAVLASQLAVLGEDVLAVEDATKIIESLIDWNKAYEVLYVACQEETYAEEVRTKALADLSANAKALAADPSAVAAKANEVYMIYHELTLTVIPEDGDVTNWINNPTIIQDGGNGDDPAGWTCWSEGTNGNRTNGSGDINFEVWASNDPADVRFDYKQTLHALPAGLYRLTVEAADRRDFWAQGESVLYAETSENWKKETSIYSHPILTDQKIKNDTVWNDPDNHDAGWSAINQVEDLDNGTYDTYTVDHITIINDGADLTIGVRCGEEGKSARWLCFDNFKLYMLERYNTGIEEIGGDAADSSLKAYAQNGRIIVEGVEDYTIYSIDSSSAYNKDAQLIPGIYIVKAGDKQTKVVVD